MGHGEDHAAVHKRQAGNGEGRIDTDLVRAVSVEQGRIRLGAVEVGAVDNGYGDIGAVGSRGPQSVSHIVIRGITAGNLLLLEVGAVAPVLRSDLGAVGSRGPQSVSHIVIRVITAGNLLLLEESKFAGIHAVIKELGGLGERHVAHAQHRCVPLGVAGYGHDEEFFVEVELFEFAKAVIHTHDGGAADAAAAVAHHNLIAVGVHALDAGGLLVRQERRQVT